MNWTKLIYVLIIVLLYVPMVFLGANVFFPQYTGSNAYFNDYNECYSKYYPAAEKTTEVEQNIISEKQRTCQEEFLAKQRAWEEKKLSYESKKYMFITLFNLLVLLFALLIPKLQDNVTMGLFVGSIASTFGATLRYFDTNSKIGFIILVIIFCMMIFFINKKKETFVDWKDKKKK